MSQMLLNDVMHLTRHWLVNNNSQQLDQRVNQQAIQPCVLQLSHCSHLSEQAIVEVLPRVLVTLAFGPMTRALLVAPQTVSAGARRTFTLSL